VAVGGSKLLIDELPEDLRTKYNEKGGARVVLAREAQKSDVGVRKSNVKVKKKDFWHGANSNLRRPTSVLPVVNQCR